MPQNGNEKSSDSGSVKVAVRLRPLNNTELASSKDSKNLRAWRVHEDRGIDSKVTRRTIRQTSEEKAIEGKSLFSFDEIFDEDAATDDIYEAVGSVIVKGSVDGRNGTIFAYGQTGSGKTYTMQGNGLTGSIPKGGGAQTTEAVDGIIQMVARDLFDHIESDPAREFLLRVSFVEVYNETVRDLLHDHEEGEFHSKRPSSPSPKSPKRNSSGDHNALVVREDPKTGGVSMNCKEVIVTDVDSLMDTLYNGEKNRIVACTDMNARSSRSHSIFSITIESRESQGGGSDNSSRSLGENWNDEEDDRAVLVSMLNLVDLAGSESVKNTNTTGTRQREGAKINQSLLTLSQVIQSLSLPKGKRPKHINYRDSKLTRILRPSLEGNAVMAILCCATAAKIYVEETKSTLRFASRAKLVQTSAKKNEVMDDRALIKRLQKELAEAKRALKELEESKEKPSVGFADDLAKDVDDTKDIEKKSAFRAKVSHLGSVILRGGGPSFTRKKKEDSDFISRRRTLGYGELKGAIGGLDGPQRKRRQQRGSISMAFQDHLVDLPLYDEEEEDDLLEENPASSEAERRESNTRLEKRDSQTNGVPNGLPLARRSSELDLLKAALELKSSRLAESEARISELEQNILESQEKSKTQVQHNRRNVLLLSACQFILFCVSVYYVAQKWGRLEGFARSLVGIILVEYFLVLVQWNFLLHHGGYTEGTRFLFEKKNA